LNLVVTGGLGFIGSNFIKNILIRTDIEKVVNIDNLTTGSNRDNIKAIDPSRYQFVKADILDTEIISRHFETADAVVNFAAETHVDRSIKDPKPFIQSNILGTYNLLEIERKLGKKIRHIQISTDETYGSIVGDAFTEDDQLKPSSPYSATKAAGDLLCNAYHSTYGMDIIVTRCTNNFGPNQFPEKLIPKTIIRALNNKSIPIYGTGKNIRDWIYVLDHCKAIEFLMAQGKSGEIYNISSGNEKTNIEIVETILEILKKPSSLIKYVDDRPGHDTRYSLHSEKLRSLGWRPEHNYDESLMKTIEWYIDNESWWRPITTPEVLGETPWRTGGRH
jgi:dTDP-glucose 4,6-dehydratase